MNWSPYWRRYPQRGAVPWPAALWATTLLTGFALLHHAVPGIMWLVPPFGATLGILYYLPRQPVAQPAPVIGGSTLGAALGTLAATWVHGPFWAAVLAVFLFVALPRLGLLHPPAIALGMFPLLLHANPWFPLAVVFPFAAIAVGSHGMLSRIVPRWPDYPDQPKSDTAVPPAL
jgi:CBS-domain-containing membrane protein